MTILLSTSSLAGIARTLVAVGTARLAVMLVTVRAAAPRSLLTSVPARGGGAAGGACCAGGAGAAGGLDGADGCAGAVLGAGAGLGAGAWAGAAGCRPMAG